MGMNYRGKVFRTVIVMMVTIALAPIAQLVREYITMRESGIHTSLQSKRFSLTQLSNNRHVLNTYADRLVNDSQLSAAVNQLGSKNKPWQTPAEQIRSRLVDGLSEIIESNKGVFSASLDWQGKYDNEANYDGEVSDSVEARSIGLKATVGSVPNAMNLVLSIKEMTKPYPLYVHGCSYATDEEASSVLTQCLLVLETWVLPFVTSQNVLNTADATNHQFDPVQNIKTTAVPAWRIFKTEPMSIDTQDVQPKSMTEKRVKDNLPSARVIESKAIIDGPAGRLVIHAPSR